MGTKRVTTWSLLGDALLGGLSGALGVGGIVIGFVAWVWKPDVKILLWVVFLIASIMSWLMVGLLSALRRSTSMLGYSSMEVVKIIPARTPYRNCKCIFQLKPVVRLPVGSSIAFHWVDHDGFERELGVGTIQRDLENLNIEATLDFVYDDPDADAFIQKLLGNDADAHRQLRVADRIPVPFKAQFMALSKGEAVGGAEKTTDTTRQLGSGPDNSSSGEGN